MTSPYWVKEIHYYVADQTVVTSPNTTPVATIQPHTIIIGKLNIAAPIVEVAEKNESAYQEALTHGVVHYPGTATIGTAGNAYLFGHSSDYLWKKGAYKTVFALLPHIAIGDHIIASDDAGIPYTYVVTETKIVRPDDTSVLDQHNNEKKLLTLQTSYPIGTVLRRFIVIAELK